MGRWTDMPGWALPSSDNKLRCDRFKRDLFSHERIENGLRYYQAMHGKGLPMVVFLHGADGTGSDNESQIALQDVATVFADPSWQVKHPCHVVAPQYPKGKHWALPRMKEYVYELTVEYARRFDADMSRIYIYGYSAGAIGIYALLKKYPIYAAAVPICGATTDLEMDALLETPMWLYHAEDDLMVRPDDAEIVYYKMPYIGSSSIYTRLKELGHRNIKYTKIPAGEMRNVHHLNPHCSWVLMGEDNEVKEWMFRQRRRV